MTASEQETPKHHEDSVPVTKDVDEPQPNLPPRPAEETQEEPHLHPQVAELHAIFPDFDPLVLQSVLEGVGGNQDKAVDKLLGMSDPEYQERHVPDQTELDEQFARQLLLDEEQQMRRRRTSDNPVPYQPRVRNSRSNTNDPSQPNEQSNSGPDFQEISESFNRIAETGKKTFSSLFNKVKAKIQEYDQPNRAEATGQAPGNLSNPNPVVHQDRHTTMMQQAYYDPGSQTPDSPAPQTRVGGYDMASPPQPVSTPRQMPVSDITRPPITSGSPRNSADLRVSSSPQRSSIDPAKVGLLPKRPVSLLHNNPPPLQSVNSKDSDDADELEYVQNPFEEEERK